MTEWQIFLCKDLKFLNGKWYQEYITIIYFLEKGVSALGQEKWEVKILGRRSEIHRLLLEDWVLNMQEKHRKT